MIEREYNDKATRVLIISSHTGLTQQASDEIRRLQSLVQSAQDQAVQKAEAVRLQAEVGSK